MSPFPSPSVPKITYADVLTKQLIENWGDNKGFNAVEQIMLNMEDRFSVSCVHIAEVRDEGAFLMLRVTTDHWNEPREFALLDTGSLAW
jgi:hypothetical protein